jgi:hypothetical protein
MHLALAGTSCAMLSVMFMGHFQLLFFAIILFVGAFTVLCLKECTATPWLTFLIAPRQHRDRHSLGAS